MFTIKELDIPDVKLVMPKLHGDERGYVAEVMHEGKMKELGLPGFAQDNQTFTRKKGTVRGLHAQKPPVAQAKLVRVLRGRIFDVAVDVRPGSPSYGRHAGAVLAADEGEIVQMYIPAGFLHGFCTLEDDTLVLYKMSALYAPGSEVGARWDDPELGIHWPVGAGEALVSAKDAALPSFKDFPKLEWLTARD